TDHYAIRSQLRIRGLDPNNHLRIIESQDGYTINESKIIEVMETEDIDILFFPSVLYQSGQRFRMQKLTEEAHKRNICVGFDIAHSIGVMPHSFGEWDVDFAVWCNYKYINGGPGAIAALYVNDKHFDKVPSLTGWWGHEKSTQFDMNLTYTPADSAGAWQIGTIPILSAAPIEGALDIFDETDIETVRDKSVQVTSYLEYLITERIDDPSLEIVTPKPREHRGGHIAITHPDAYRISQALRDKDVIVDFRDPDIIRICPAPLYTQYQDVWSVVAELNNILRTETYQDYDKEKDGVT
ncbi:MAG: kynureninase, partial [Halobacteriaceae archaeon]